jgi:serine/threonine protein kinase
LLKKMLCFNPEQRISLQDVMNHPYFVGTSSDCDVPVVLPISQAVNNGVSWV